MIIDFHTHIFPDRLNSFLNAAEKNSLAQPWVGNVREKLVAFRKQGRSWIRPVADLLHTLQPKTRNAPSLLRNWGDEIGSLAVLPNLLVESTVEDLEDARVASKVDMAVIIAHPPYAMNEFILEEARKNSELIAAVNLIKGTRDPAKVLRQYVDQGAKLLKIHPSSDGLHANSSHYKKLIATAAELGLPVIIHTGCIHMSLMYQNFEASHAEEFTPWFKKFPQVQFILAHMNYHAPQIAIDLMKKFQNVYVDTSWQPGEVIVQAISEAGADRILFGSDWPLGGNNISASLKRIQQAREAGLITVEDSKKILGLNAAKLLGLRVEI